MWRWTSIICSILSSTCIYTKFLIFLPKMFNKEGKWNFIFTRVRSQKFQRDGSTCWLLKKSNFVYRRNKMKVDENIDNTIRRYVTYLEWIWLVEVSNFTLKRTIACGGWCISVVVSAFWDREFRLYPLSTPNRSQSHGIFKEETM